MLAVEAPASAASLSNCRAARGDKAKPVSSAGSLNNWSLTAQSTAVSRRMEISRSGLPCPGVPLKTL